MGALLAPLAAHAFPNAGATYLARSYLRTYQAASRKSANPLLGQGVPAAGFAPSVQPDIPAEAADGDLELRAGRQVRELVIVDAGIPESVALRSGLRPGLELVVLRGNRPGLDELADVLARYRDLAAVHLVTHGEPGALWLGGSRVDAAALEANPRVLRALRGATRPGADLLLYGCDVAAKDDSLLELIKARAHVDVAASGDLTGDERLGGDWELEIRKGRIDAGVAFSEVALRDYRHVLRPPNGEFRFANYLRGDVKYGHYALYTTIKNGLVIESVATDVFASDPGMILVFGMGKTDTSVRGELRFLSDDGAEFGVSSMVLGVWRGYETQSVSILGFRNGIEVGRKDVPMPAPPVGGIQFTLVSVDLTTDLVGGSFQDVDAIYVDVVDVDSKWSALVDNMVVYGPPAVSDAHISISGGTGTGGAYIVGDTVTATWDASPAGDRANDVTSVTVDFSEFGGGLVPATKSAGDVWTATYEIAPGTIDATGRNVRVTAENPFGAVTTADTTNALVDNQPPALSSTLVGLGSPREPGRPVILNDTIWVAWSPLWDSSLDRVTQVTVDFSEFGGGSAVPATTGTGLWRAEYTIDAASNQGDDLRASITVTDDAGNTTTIRSAAGLDVDNEAPSGYRVAFDDTVINAARAASAAFTIVGGEAGATYTYSIDSAGGGATVHGSGSMAGAAVQVSGVDLSGLADGSLTMAFQLSDAAGNPGVVVHATAVLDKTAPPTPSTPDLVPASDTGVSSSDDITSDATPTLVGTAEPASQVRLSSDVDGLIGVATADADGAWTVTVAAALSEGAHEVTAVALDAAGNASEPSPALALVIDVAAPSAADDAAETDEDESVQVDVLANDDDPGSSLNPASVRIARAPDHGSASVNTATGVVTYSPAPNFAGVDTFTYTVDDLHGGTSPERTVTITVHPVNDPPVAVGDVASTSEDTPLLIDVAANDTDVDDGDAVDPSTIALVTGPTNGAAVLEAGRIRYTPSLAFIGTDQLTYTIRDGQGAVSNTAVVVINVAGVNQAPSANADFAVTQEDEPVEIAVLANDTDLDGAIEPGTVQIIEGPAHGTVSIDGVTGIVTYSPAADFHGDDEFTYVVRDSGGATSSAAVVSITVESVNDAPAAADDTVVLEEDVPHAINVLGNDSDVEGNLDASSVEVVAGPASGTTAVDPATGVITYTPGEDFNGDDLFRYRVRDEDGLWSNDAAVRLTVEPVNDAPLANDDDAATDEDVSVRILVLDNDDDVEGHLNPSSVAIVRAPTLGAATVEHDGSITYTPDADTSGTDEFTYTVADDEGALSNEATVTVSIRAVNDAPTISGTPPAVVDVGEAYEFTPVIDDVEGDPLTVSAENLPAWLSLDPDTGALSGTPAEAHVGDYPGIVLRVGDGSATTALAAFSIQVRGEPDSDADGMPDDYELEQGFDPLDPSDAAADADGDGVSNRDELDAGTNPLEDDYAPEISAASVVEIDAVGLLTPFPALAAPSAVDGRDGNVQPVLEGDAAYLPPGLHRVVWAATDAAGNRAEIEQLIKVHPQISLAPDEVRAEGSTAEVRFILNGPSPSYPLTVAFNVDGTASLGADHDLYPGTITFEEGELEKRVPVAIAADAVPEGAETIEIALVGPGNVGPHRTQTVTIIEQNAAPRVSLALAQDGRLARIVTAEGGQVLVSAFVDDPNPGDTHTFEWWFPKGAVTASVADGVEALDPSSLPPGVHELRVVVRDSGVPALETEIVESFRVVETPPEVAADDDSDGDGLDDEAEGFGDVDDDGSPDYLDGRHRPNVLAERIGDGGDFLIETEPGLRLMLGSVAQLRGGAGAGLSAEDMTAAGIGPDSITNVGGHVDFVVRDIPTAGASVAVVIPQRQPIPENPVYRKHDGIWFTLVEDARNRLASAPGERGVCPPPGSGEYRPGLNAGDWCVELTIEDGGPNDTDGLANGMIRDPGGVGTLGRVSPPSPPPPSVGGGRSGGGGAFGLAGLLGLLGVATLRRRWGRGRRSAPRADADTIRAHRRR